MPQVKELGNRIFQIYALTIATGTLIASVGVGIMLLSPMLFVFAFFIGGIVTGIICLPNIIILNLGLKYIYKHSISEEQKRHYFYYLWLLISVVPILLFIGLMIEGGLRSWSQLFLPLPYILSSLYYLFSVNNKFDALYKPKFTPPPNEDILDGDWNRL